LGTWTSQDPLQYINGVNTYQFVMSNPVGNLDPSGEVVHVMIYGSFELTAGMGGSIEYGYAWDDCGNSAQFLGFSERVGVNIGITALNPGIFSGCLKDFLHNGATGVDVTVASGLASGTGTLGIGGAGSGFQGGLGLGKSLKVGASIGLDEVFPIGHPDLSHKCPCHKHPRKKCSPGKPAQPAPPPPNEPLWQQIIDSMSRFIA
jgi:hypothetical protein